MPDSDTVRPPAKRVLRPVHAPKSHVQPPTPKSEVIFALPGIIPDPESLRIRTIWVPQPFLEPDALKQQ
ncbi:hypothetical protein EDB81DRAFT_388766 [Dactylonectria macrodidyma]|uniref:Uncharacterized protein n=1 Tax=Dactylonectria macrodidyma TaxID=307937 RepID=A0A9P9F7Z8_9HYPO|nr:hypothetical protein EDB81DRAFT_388766 [Dactylonectria macrodidyma]